jgi:RHS repeat-associated protein
MKNLQGDVIAITDCDGDVIVKYSYDAWGVPTIKSDTSGCSLATVNPFRYRGYYYDAEIGMYYLMSRYYSPDTGRFISVDDPEIILADTLILHQNLFAYCYNSPIASFDVYGRITAQLIARIILGLMVGVVAQLLSDLFSFVFAKLYGKESNFAINPGDYISSAISWATTCVAFNSKFMEVFFTVIPIVFKQIYKIFLKTFQWVDFIIDIIFAILSFILSSRLSRKLSKKIGQVKAKAGNSNKAQEIIRIKTQRLNLKAEKWGIKLNIKMNISSFFVGMLYNFATNAYDGKSVA